MKEINTPDVSIIMPMRNAEAYIIQAIDSILSQSFRDLELVVIDDQSTDNSRAIVEDILKNDSRIKLIDGCTQGIAAAKNKGLQHASGQFIMFCDADDLYAKNCVENQFNWLASHPDTGAVCAQFAMMDPNGGNVVNLVSEVSSSDITDELLSGKTRTHLCTFIIRREFIDQINGFREFFETAEDIDFQLRLAEACKIGFVSSVVYYYRLHDSSIVHTQASSKREFFEESARLFRRQRAGNEADYLQLGIPPEVPGEYGHSVDPKTQLQGALIGTAWRLHQQGKKIKAIKNGLRACLINPSNLMVWKSYFMLFLK
jgi:glycosyltransferase involved in cell wall biosynthesis